MDFGKVFSGAMPLLLEGLKLTVITSLVSILIGMVIGLLVCLMKMSKNVVLRAIAGVYIWIIRGTPMLVQAFIVFFGVPQVVRMFVSDFKFTALTAGIITLSLNAGAYLAEIYRGGIMAVPKGQTEAARSLGLSQGQAMRKVVLPQAIKFSIPSLVNQFIITIKDTSILSAIGMAELVNKAKTYVGSTYTFFETYLVVAAMYLVIISILMIISNYIEKKLKYERRGRRRDEH
ncbi:MAG: amino acid ABC transporter permease [Ruminococcus sp.]|uniref:amino acid ABC transporter permease n=1 Tax=Ruminococcus sp. TaxID=41978 RepID=UPI00386D5052|nr:amino acid ABC transporter permease [Ruminococcus sp.]